MIDEMPLASAVGAQFRSEEKLTTWKDKGKNSFVQTDELLWNHVFVFQTGVNFTRASLIQKKVNVFQESSHCWTNQTGHDISIHEILCDSEREHVRPSW